MTEQDLPAPVTRAIEAVNAGDTDAFLSEFAAGGWIDDNGRRFSGHDATRAWSDRELPEDTRMADAFKTLASDAGMEVLGPPLAQSDTGS